MGRNDVPFTAVSCRWIDLPAEPSSAALARRFVRAVIHGAGPADVEDAALLCVTELVANASLHTGSTTCRVTVGVTPANVTLEVTDQSPDPPSFAPAAPEAESGRGLRIVDSLACEWGIRPDPPGKSIWLRLN